MTKSMFPQSVLAAVLSVLAVFLFTAASAQAESRVFEMGLSAGYTYGMALTPADASDTPSVTSDGHGFAATISAGGRLTDSVGLYADFGLNQAFMSKSATIGNWEVPEESVLIEKGDYQYLFSALLMLRYYQDFGHTHLFEGFGLGIGYAGDTFAGEDPGLGFAVKAQLGCLYDVTHQIQLGIAGSAMVNHRMSRDYMNMSVGAEIVTVYHF